MGFVGIFVLQEKQAWGAAGSARVYSCVSDAVHRKQRSNIVTGPTHRLGATAAAMDEWPCAHSSAEGSVRAARQSNDGEILDKQKEAERVLAEARVAAQKEIQEAKSAAQDKQSKRLGEVKAVRGSQPPSGPITACFLGRHSAQEAGIDIWPHDHSHGRHAFPVPSAACTR